MNVTVTMSVMAGMRVMVMMIIANRDILRQSLVFIHAMGSGVPGLFIEVIG
jgi:hypothetical protein